MGFTHGYSNSTLSGLFIVTLVCEKINFEAVISGSGQEF